MEPPEKDFGTDLPGSPPDKLNMENHTDVKNWEFEAPQYVDFSALKLSEAEAQKDAEEGLVPVYEETSFFNHDHEYESVIPSGPSKPLINRLTIPKSPKFSKRADRRIKDTKVEEGHKGRGKSDKIKNWQKRLQSMDSMLAPPELKEPIQDVDDEIVVTRLTVPKPFRFETTKRFGSKVVENAVNASNDHKKRVATSSKHGSQPASHLTVPKPFTLSKSKPKEVARPDHFSPAVNNMDKYVKSLRSTKSKVKTPTQLTQPVSFHFATRDRVRKTKDRVEKSPEFKPFKAKPLNRKIISRNGNMGLHTQGKKTLTQPKEFQLSRGRLKKPTRDNGPVNAPVRKRKTKLELTVPKPFNFAKVTRSKKRQPVDHSTTPHPKTQTKVPKSKGRLKASGPTIPQPFNLSSKLKGAKRMKRGDNNVASEAVRPKPVRQKKKRAAPISVTVPQSPVFASSKRAEQRKQLRKDRRERENLKSEQNHSYWR